MIGFQDILPIVTKIGVSFNKNIISGRLKSTFIYFMTVRKILILSSIYSQVPQIFPSLTVVKQILCRKVAVFLHNQWNSSIHGSSIYLRILEKKSYYLSLCKNAEDHYFNILSESLETDER